MRRDGHRGGVQVIRAHDGIYHAMLAPGAYAGID